MKISDGPGPRQVASRRRVAGVMAVGASLAIGLLGCETLPTHIDGRKVVGMRHVDGRRVYMVESRQGDRVEVIEIAAESARAAKGVVFEGTR